VIWIFGDQDRAQAVGNRGDPNVGTPNWLLHTLNDDPYEQANRAHDSAFQGQRRRLPRWIKETGDGFALPEVELPR
jgi:hypothetical protein